MKSQQGSIGRRTNSFRGVLSEGVADGAAKSPVGLFWLLLHGLCCIISLVLGFRFSRLIFYVLFSASATTRLSTTGTTVATDLSAQPLLNVQPERLLTLQSVARPSPPPSSLQPPPARSKVVVGRHGIRIRPYPHPNSEEVMRAHMLIDRVQAEQRRVYGVKKWKRLVVITPTYVRTFQTVHLTGLMHTLMLVPGDLTWIVVEAGGVSNETASLISASGLDMVHVGFNEQMPIYWEGRHLMEARMRLHGLRIVREKRLDGIVMFCDDSNMHSLELFDEVQSVKWVGALSVGILAHSGRLEGTSGGEISGENLDGVGNKEEEQTAPLPVQGPACNSSGQLVGWHTFNSLPYMHKSAALIDDGATVLPRKLEWAGFVLNSRLVWKNGDLEVGTKPEWVKDLDEINENGDVWENPLSLLKDASFVEPLGKCGRKVMLWWLRVEARADSKFPRGWIIDPPLEIVVPAKRTPWPDVPPELTSMSTARKGLIGDHTEKRKAPRRKRSTCSKRKHGQQEDVRGSGASGGHVEKR
ncbi:putative beta-1-4-xylosyltransferase [Nymphaea thermarum]|nr:putative beta-1-4-xylosyltransferase [Nymphaea thermarum]